MTVEPTTSEINAQTVRAGFCWDDGTSTRPLPGNWLACPTCDKRWLLASDHVIIERLPIPPEIIGKRAGILAEGTTIVCEDESKLLAHVGDLWLIPAEARYIECLWPTPEPIEP